jgi:hypothetical protein
MTKLSARVLEVEAARLQDASILNSAKQQQVSQPRTGWPDVLVIKSPNVLKKSPKNIAQPLLNTRLFKLKNVAQRFSLGTFRSLKDFKSNLVTVYQIQNINISRSTFFRKLEKDQAYLEVLCW